MVAVNMKRLARSECISLGFKLCATPEVCDNRYCYYDALHKDYVYVPAWVDFLVKKLSDTATYDLIVKCATPPRTA
jgi:hypothetical protein